jgi:hypothetical protein
MDMTASEGLALLRTPFPANQINYVPKGGVKLAFVGHAALTDRLLDADPNWTWEPLSMSDNGLPVMDDMGGMWIRLTVCGVTRLGYGHAGAKTGGDAIKEVIGDALRNAAMRFGAALDLWHKGELHAEEPVAVTHTAKGVPMVAADKRTPSVAQTVLNDSPPIADERKAELIDLAGKITKAIQTKGAEWCHDRLSEEELDDIELIFLATKMDAATRNALRAVSVERNRVKAMADA